MTRPWLIWLLSLLCAAGIFGAMGVITHRSLRVEQEGAQARADAELQERIRLALWRMETEASALLIEENNRPPEHFRAKNGTSPLAGPAPKYVRLHFEIEGDGKVVSPQAFGSGAVPPAEAVQNLTRLRQLLERSPAVSWCAAVLQPMVAAQDKAWDNRVFLEAAAKKEGPFEQQAEPVQNDAFGAANQADIKQQQAAPVPAEAMKQQLFNNAELSKRAQVYTKAAEGKFYLKEPPGPSAGMAQSPTSSASADDRQTLAVQGSVQQVTNDVQAPRMATAAPSPIPEQPVARIQSDASAPADGQAQVVITGAESQSSLSRVTPFRPFWLEDELFLVREVAGSGRRHVQGVWLDASSLRKSLLDTIADILPQAVLQPVATVAFACTPGGQLLPAATPPMAADPLTLVGIPWRLAPGEAPYAVVPLWTPMRLTLAAAWIGALLAALAAAGLLFGVTRLSERRAAFVSSVTHELRTPLTTFRLYSELLEQGMVREEADRVQYLRTLRTEAERLTHLVDNVLAYSRIERANRRARMECVELVAWLDRVKGRLEDHAKESSMTLAIHIAPDAQGLRCLTDATALEQILFNLVDNACKYAADRCAEPSVQVMLERRGRWVELRVCDTGPGIARGERSRLFRPFHKSADEAANSKPGVGLGLALCHRLAKALGGRLTLEQNGAQSAGACFVLRLPAGA